MIKHFCFIAAEDYRVILNPSNPFYGLTHDEIVTKFNTCSFNKDNELLHYLFDLTSEIAAAAIAFNGDMLASLHPDLFTAELCRSALKSRKGSAMTILKSKKMHDDADLVLDCVHTYPECISILGDKQTEELCKIAVTEDPWCIEFVNDQTKDICDIVLESKPAAIRFIRNPTIEQYVTALCNDPACSMVIPDRYLVQIVDSLSTYGKISLLTNFTGGRRESGSSLQADKLKTLRKDWRTTNLHPSKQ